MSGPRPLAAGLAAARRAPQAVLIGLIRGYRLLLKPWLGNACRFEPTCSAYALEAVSCHGAAVGAPLAAARLLRCHPWCAGGADPVPSRQALSRGLFGRLGLIDAPPVSRSLSSPAAPSAADANP